MADVKKCNIKKMAEPIREGDTYYIYCMYTWLNGTIKMGCKIFQGLSDFRHSFLALIFGQINLLYIWSSKLISVHIKVISIASDLSTLGSRVNKNLRLWLRRLVTIPLWTFFMTSGLTVVNGETVSESCLRDHWLIVLMDVCIVCIYLFCRSCVLSDGVA